MEFTREQEVLQQVINEAWENKAFKAELMANPVAAIENLTGEKLDLKGKELIVRDQTDESTIYINSPGLYKSFTPSYPAARGVGRSVFCCT